MHNGSEIPLMVRKMLLDTAEEENIMIPIMVITLKLLLLSKRVAVMWAIMEVLSGMGQEGYYHIMTICGKGNKLSKSLRIPMIQYQ